MDARVERVVRSFENNGWRAMAAVDIKPDWWFDDIIMLQSVWRPVGKYIYLTLLTDAGNIKRKIVLDIGISTELQVERNSNWLKQISLNDIKRIDLEKVVQEINEIVLKEN